MAYEAIGASNSAARSGSGFAACSTADEYLELSFAHTLRSPQPDASIVTARARVGIKSPNQETRASVELWVVIEQGAQTPSFRQFLPDGATGQTPFPSISVLLGNLV